MKGLLLRQGKVCFCVSERFVLLLLLSKFCMLTVCLRVVPSLPSWNVVVVSFLFWYCWVFLMSDFGCQKRCLMFFYWFADLSCFLIFSILAQVNGIRPLRLQVVVLLFRGAFPIYGIPWEWPAVTVPATLSSWTFEMFPYSLDKAPVQHLLQQSYHQGFGRLFGSLL